MKRQKLSVLIHTLDEIDQIGDCLRSVAWADEVYLLDSFSTDGTWERVGDEFPHVIRERHRSLGSAAQKNYGTDRVSHDWVLVIDADERVPPELRDEILEILEAPRYWAYTIRRTNIVLGREIRFGTLGRDRVRRLFHRGHARYPNRRVHADLAVDGLAPLLRNRFTHYYIRSFSHMAEKMVRYAFWGAAQLYRDGRRASAFDAVFHASWRFAREMFLHGGILDGTRGLVVSAVHSYYTFLKYACLWEYGVLERKGRPVPLPEFDTDSRLWTRPWEEEEREPASEPEVTATRA